MDKFYEREDVANGEVKLKVTLPADAFTQSYQQLLKDRLSNMQLKGFRKGNIPAEMVDSNMKGAILAETFEKIAPYYVNAAIIKENLDPVAPPAYTDLEKLEENKPVKFSVVVTVMPEFKVGDLKKIKIKQEKLDATEEEVENTLKSMWENARAIKNAGKEAKEDKAQYDRKLLTDAWAKEVADLYHAHEVTSMKELVEFIKEAIMKQKKNIARQHDASEAVREAVKVSKITVPQPAVEYEAQQREDAFKEDLKRVKTSIAEFCKAQGVKYSDLQEKWKADALEALENDILFKQYAKEHELEIDDDELLVEIEKIKLSNRQYAQREQEIDESIYENPQWKAYIKTVLVKQKAYQEIVKQILGADFFDVEEEEEHDHHHHDHEDEVKAAKKAKPKKKAKSK
ncbi:MAG: trigger factor [Candidatus Dojkabacteria bacterium]|nr:MAG: trigger factor [Candidatus Dojkabacteria bacterium]